TVRAASDRALAARLTDGAMLVVPAGRAGADETCDVAALAAYLPTLGTTDAALLRAGRLVYEGACAACHGAYGHAEGAIGSWLGVPDLLEARTRYSDASLARISKAGVGRMPPLLDGF